MRKFLETRLPEVLLYAALFIAFCGLIGAGGCVNRQLAESYGQYLGTVGTEYIQYVQADSTLTDDDKAIRQNNHEQAVETVNKFKETKWSW